MIVSTNKLAHHLTDKHIRKACELTAQLIAKGLKPSLAIWKVADVYGIDSERIKKEMGLSWSN